MDRQKGKSNGVVNERKSKERKGIKQRREKQEDQTEEKHVIKPERGWKRRRWRARNICMYVYTRLAKERTVKTK